MDIIERLNWRYATKKFDPSLKLSKDTLEKLLQAVNLSASSYGMQPFSVMVISDPELKDKLRAASYDQEQITSASHLILFAAHQNLDEKDADEYIQRIINTRGVTPDSLAAYREKIRKSIRTKTPDALLQWASRQTYIALGFLLVAAAVEGIDACPMEGIEKDKYDEILGLKAKGLTSVVMAAAGYRASDDKYQFKTKVRKKLSELVTFYD